MSIRERVWHLPQIFAHAAGRPLSQHKVRNCNDQLMDDSNILKAQCLAVCPVCRGEEEAVCLVFGDHWKNNPRATSAWTIGLFVYYLN